MSVTYSTMSSSSSTTATSTVTTDGLTFRCVSEERRVLPRNEARELFAPLREKPYNTVILGGYAFGDGAAYVAGAALLELARKKCVRKIVFADCIASLPGNEALRTLRSLCSSIGSEWKGLHSVDLSYNPLGSFGLAECAPVLSGQTELQHLRLVQAGLAVQSARLLNSYIGVRRTTRLRTLKVHASQMDSAGTILLAEIVEKSPDLECVRLSSLRAPANAIARVAFALHGKDKLRDLDLSDNYFDIPAAEALGEVLLTLPNLERLALRDLQMRDAGLNALLKRLIAAKRKPALSGLALAGNELSPVAAPILESMLFEYADTLKSLDLSRNDLGSTTAQSLADALARTREADKEIALSKLSLAKNQLSATSIVRLVIQLVSISDFKLLDIMENRIPEDVNNCISNALGTDTVLYDVDDAPIDSDDEESTPSMEITPELQAAMDQLANTPSRVRREIRFSEKRTEGSEQSSQSRSTVSRLRSLFSKGSEKETEQTTSQFPSALEDVSPPLESAPPGSIQDDSGVMKDSSESGTPGASSPGSTVDRTTVLSAAVSSGERDTEDAMATASNSASARIVTSPEQPESARKLQKSLASLQQEFTNLSSEFTPSPPSVYTAGGNMYSASLNGPSGNVNDYLLTGELSQDDTGKQTALAALVNILGGLLIGAFLLVLVLAIVQSLEESTFAYRPV